MAESLRALLEPGRQNDAFVRGSVADVEVAASAIHHKLSAMHRGLVAHDALNAMLHAAGLATCDKLWDAIDTANWARWLLHVNKTANEAKHACMASSPL